MSNKLATMIKKWVLVFLFSVLIYGANFWGLSIYVLDEAKNAACAMEMLQRGDLIVPTFNGELRTDKPPLHYFFMMLAYSVFGINSFAARLFSVIAGVVMVLHLYGFLKRNFNESSAFATSMILISSIQLAIQFHLAVPDPYLILTMTSSLLFFYEGYTLNSNKKMMSFYIIISLGFLAKGVIAIALPGLIILLFLFARNELKLESINKLRLLYGILIFVLVALPWYILVGYETEGLWLEGFFLKHNLARYTTTMEGHRGFFLAPFVILIIALCPFSFFIIQAMRHALKFRVVNPFILLSLITIIVIPGFFSLSKTQLPSYPAPALPFLSVILGIYWNEKFSKRTKKKWHEWIALSAYAVVAVAIPIGVHAAMSSELPNAKLEHLAYYFLLLPIGACIGLLFYWSGIRKDMMYIYSGSWMFTAILFFYACFPQVDRVNPVSKSIPILKGQKIAYFGALNPAYVFTLKSPLQRLNSSEDVRKFLAEKGRVITQEAYLPELTTVDFKVIFKQKDLFENPVTVIIE